MNHEDKTELFEKMPVPKALATLAFPTIISQLINLVYNIVDTFFIGRTGNSYMVGAVTLAFSLYMMTIAISNMFGIGGGSLVARLSGRQEPENARKICAFSFYGAVGSALLYSLLIFAFLDPLLNLLGASVNTMTYAKQYVWLVVILGNLPVILSMTLSHLLRNAGFARQSSLGLGIGGVLNMALDPILMFVLLPKGMEVFGAALATLLSNIVSCLYLLFALIRLSGKTVLSVDFRLLKGIRREDLKELFAVGVPSALLTGMVDVANMFLNRLMVGHSDLALAAIGIVMKAERIPNAVNVGICQGMLPIVAYNYAQKNHERQNEVIRIARFTGLVVSCFCVLMFEIFAAPVVSVFLSTSAGDAATSAATIGLAAVFLRLRCPASPVQFLNYHTSFCMQAMGDGRDTLIHAMARDLCFYIPFMFLLNALFGQNGLAFAMPAGETCGALLALFLLSRFLKKNGADAKASKPAKA